LYKKARKFGFLLLSFYLLASINTAFAITYEECVQNLKSDPANTAGCQKLIDEGNECLNNLPEVAKEVCEAYKQTNYANCEQLPSPMSESCKDKVDDEIEECKKNYVENPANKAGCVAKIEEGEKCLKDFEQFVIETCQAQAAQSNPDGNDDNNGTDGPATTTPPEIPDIKTLPRPNVQDVGQVSEYLQIGLLPRVAMVIISLAIGGSVVMIIYGSIQLLTAYGDTEKYSTAKKTIMFALVGLVIALLSYAIVQIIFFTGYNIGQA
jgi:predicted Rossmann fold nucleotide-binding protein DprA/Smf involved in DNA uptake